MENSEQIRWRTVKSKTLYYEFPAKGLLKCNVSGYRRIRGLTSKLSRGTFPCQCIKSMQVYHLSGWKASTGDYGGSQFQRSWEIPLVTQRLNGRSGVFTSQRFPLPTFQFQAAPGYLRWVIFTCTRVRRNSLRTGAGIYISSLTSFSGRPQTRTHANHSRYSQICKSSA